MMRSRYNDDWKEENLRRRRDFAREAIFDGLLFSDITRIHCFLDLVDQHSTKSEPKVGAMDTRHE